MSLQDNVLWVSSHAFFLLKGPSYAFGVEHSGKPGVQGGDISAFVCAIVLPTQQLAASRAGNARQTCASPTSGSAG